MDQDARLSHDELIEGIMPQERFTKSSLFQMKGTLHKAKKLTQRPKSACERHKKVKLSTAIVDNKRDNIERGKRILKETLRLEKNLEAEREMFLTAHEYTL